MTTTAASVSAVLHRAGITTVSPADRRREGVKVTRGAGRSVTVNADFDLEGMAARRATLVREVLEGLGYAVTPNPHSAALLTVTREG